MFGMDWMMDHWMDILFMEHLVYVFATVQYLLPVR